MTSTESKPRTVVPPCVAQAPMCPCCLRETDVEADGPVCRHCDLAWGWNGGPGERVNEDDPDIAVCGAEIRPFPDHPDLADITYRCVLDEHKDAADVRHAGPRVAPTADLEDVHLWRTR